MIDRSEILAVAADLSLEANVVEKDYVLGWLLAGIYTSQLLAEKWVFKGGTCLKKCYFETYRFSEDLDFTLTDRAQLDTTFLLDAFRSISQWVYNESLPKRVNWKREVGQQTVDLLRSTKNGEFSAAQKDAAG